MKHVRGCRGEDGYMWRTARSRSGVNSTLITVVSAFLSLLIASPGSAAAARVAHSRIRSAAPKPAAAAGRQIATGILNPDREMLLRLQEGQRTLEKQAAEFNAGIQTRIRQLSSGIEDSERKTQEMLEQTAQRIDSIRRLLKLIIALLLLSWGGLFYVARQLPKLQDKSVAWKGKIPESAPDEEGIVNWQKGEPPNAREGWKFER
jgi:hypothetical protein